MAEINRICREKQSQGQSSETVRRAVILAAGRGQRLDPLTTTLPKPLLPVAGVPVLENALDNLAAVGLSEVAIVVGHLGEQIEQRFQRTYRGMTISYVDANQYAETNNVVSLWLAREHLREDCIVLEGDVFFGEQILQRLLALGLGSVAAVDRMQAHMTGTVAALDRKDTVQALSIRKSDSQAPGPSEPDLQWKTLSIYFFKKQFSEELLIPEIERTVQAGQCQEFYEQSLIRIVEQVPEALLAVRCEGCPWIEIDDLQDYGRAQLVFSSSNDQPAPLRGDAA